MYDAKSNCIFLHIPKAAGSSVEKALGRQVPGPDHKSAYWWMRNRRGTWENAKKFCFVRNPWDLMTSLFRYHKQYNWSTQPSVIRDSTFPEFIRNLDSLLPTSATPDAAKDRISSRTFNQLDAVTSDPWLWDAGKQEFVHKTDTTTPLVDRVWRVEDLPAAWDEVRSWLGVSLPELGRERSTAKLTPFTAYYDDETRDIIAKRFERDINYFQYSFQP